MNLKTEHQLRTELSQVWAMLESEREHRKWRPIETAPKDGTLILIGNPESDDMPATTTVGRWFESYEDSVDEKGCDAGFCDVDFSLFHAGRSFGAESSRYEGLQPTHWMPLPAPPAGA